MLRWLASRSRSLVPHTSRYRDRTVMRVNRSHSSASHSRSLGCRVSSASFRRRMLNSLTGHLDCTTEAEHPVGLSPYEACSSHCSALYGSHRSCLPLRQTSPDDLPLGFRRVLIRTSTGLSTGLLRQIRSQDFHLRRRSASPGLSALLRL
jgi:hypothetical protein